MMTPPASAPSASAAFRVPLAALADTDEADASITPGVGDRVAATVEFAVDSIEGDHAMVRPTMINGQPMAEAAATAMSEEESLDTEAQELEAELRQMDAGALV